MKQVICKHLLCRYGICDVMEKEDYGELVFVEDVVWLINNTHISKKAKKEMLEALGEVDE